MTLLLKVIVTTATCSLVFGQNSDELSRCMCTAKTQLAMNVCAGEEAKRAEAQWNDVYQQLQSAAGKTPGAVEKIRAAEKAWVAYRDAYIEATYPANDKQAAYGSMFPMEVLLLQADFAQQHTNALREMLKHYSTSR